MYWYYRRPENVTLSSPLHKISAHRHFDFVVLLYVIHMACCFHRHISAINFVDTLDNMENSSVDANIHNEDEDEGGSKPVLPQNIVEGDECKNEYHQKHKMQKEIYIKDQCAGLFDNCMCRCVL